MTQNEMVKELRQRHFSYVASLEKENKELRATIQNAVKRCQECQYKFNASKTLEQENEVLEAQIPKYGAESPSPEPTDPAPIRDVYYVMTKCDFETGTVTYELRERSET